MTWKLNRKKMTWENSSTGMKVVYNKNGWSCVPKPHGTDRVYAIFKPNGSFVTTSQNAVRTFKKIDSALATADQIAHHKG